MCCTLSLPLSLYVRACLRVSVGVCAHVLVCTRATSRACSNSFVRLVQVQTKEGFLGRVVGCNTDGSFDVEIPEAAQTRTITSSDVMEPVPFADMALILEQDGVVGLAMEVQKRTGSAPLIPFSPSTTTVRLQEASASTPSKIASSTELAAADGTAIDLAAIRLGMSMRSPAPTGGGPAQAPGTRSCLVNEPTSSNPSFFIATTPVRSLQLDSPSRVHGFGRVHTRVGSCSFCFHPLFCVAGICEILLVCVCVLSFSLSPYIMYSERIRCKNGQSGTAMHALRVLVCVGACWMCRLQQLRGRQHLHHPMRLHHRHQFLLQTQQRRRCYMWAQRGRT